MITSLSPREAAPVGAAHFTYPEVGGTAGALPPGYRHVNRIRAFADCDFDEAATRLLTWRAHERSGLRVAASSPRAEPGTVVLMRLGPGPLAVRIPCRVVYVIDEPGRAGFAYGTLPGHPESGEELFLLQRDDRGGVTVTVSAFSRRATLLARAGGVVTRCAQDRMAERYLQAIGCR